MNTARRIATILGAGALMFSAPALVSADCPLSLIQIGNVSDSQVRGPSATRHNVNDPYGSGDAWFLDWGDSLGFDIHWSGGGGGQMDVRGDFKVLGADSGTTVPFRLEAHVRGDMYTINAMDACFGDRQFDDLFVGGVQVASHSWTTHDAGGGSGNCTNTFQVVYDVSVNAIAGQSFQIEQIVDASASSIAPIGGSAQLGLSLWFRDLPPGTFVVACDGDTATHVLGVGGRTSSGLALDAVWPNPSRGEIHASCALPRGGPVVLRLFDAAGRVTETRIWDAPSASRREITLGGRLAPGAYFLQVSQGATSATKAVTIVR